MAHDIFISYSSKDKATADAVCAVLEARRLRCWMAPKSILPGQEYAEAIVDALATTRAMVLIFSAHSNESPQVKREVERAASKGITIIPFRIADVRMCKSLEYYLSDHHWLDAMTPPVENHIQKLADTLKILLGKGGPMAAVKKQTRNLLSIYSYLHRKGGLARHVAGLSEENFVKHLEKVSAEFEHLSLALQLGNQDSVREFSHRVLEALQCKIVNMLSADRASIFWVDAERQTLRTISVDVGVEEHLRARKLEIPIKSGIAGHVATTGKALNIPDAYACPYFNPGPDRDTGYKTRSVLCVPVMDGLNRVCAVSSVLNKKTGGAFTEDDEERFIAFAAHMSPILQTVSAIQKHV